MNISKCILALVVMAGMGCATTSYAQGAAAGALSPTGSADFGEDRSTLGMNPEQARRISNYIYSAEAMNRIGLKKVATKEELMVRAKELITVLKLACEPTDVELAGDSSEKEAGKLYQSSLYEISCTDGNGYFLNSHDRVRKEGGKPDHPTAATSVALSCMSADKIHNDDIQNGVKSELYCHLQNNAGGDMLTLSQRLLAAAGVNCNVSQYKWFGVKQESKTEFTEVACDNGTGYLLQTALPGGDAKPSAMNCTDALARNGLECRLTKIAKPVTLATFKEYLANTKVECSVTDYDHIKVLGRENTKQRYVVEFKCAQQPNGLVAFIPLDGNTNSFETVDCKTVKTRGLTCKLTTAP